MWYYRPGTSFLFIFQNHVQFLVMKVIRRHINVEQEQIFLEKRIKADNLLYE